MKDKEFMMRAIKLAKKANGKTYPNPMVGAVLVKNGKVIGEGYHKKSGMPHAEIVALQSAKKNIEGATLYVTLEPCAHHGKTPPCVDSIMSYGIKRVFAAMTDPNPLVNGKGLKFLRKKGIKTKVGVCQSEAKKLNKVYIESFK